MNQDGKAYTAADRKTIAAACCAPLVDPPKELTPTVPRVRNWWTAGLREARSGALLNIRVTLRRDVET